jgi:hypothetical protein
MINLHRPKQTLYYEEGTPFNTSVIWNFTAESLTLKTTKWQCPIIKFEAFADEELKIPLNKEIAFIDSTKMPYEA